MRIQRHPDKTAALACNAKAAFRFTGAFVKRFLVAPFIALVLVTGGVVAHAEEYPSRPITMIIPFPAGGSTDVLGRVLAQSMSKLLGQQVVVENGGGAGGTLGTARAAKSANDGYTIFFHNMAHATAPALYRNLSYDPVDSFEHIGLVADVPMILVARKDFPAADFKEALAYIKAKKEEIKFANAGVGSTSHLCGLLFASKIDTAVTPVPYRGTGPALNDILGGQVDFICDQPASTVGHIKAGKIKPYAVATKARVAAVPDVPTFDESGLPGFKLAVWHGLYAPKGTPKPIVEKLSAALQQALKDAFVVQRFAELGADPPAPERVTPQALRAHVKAELEKWAPIIKKAGVTAE